MYFWWPDFIGFWDLSGKSILGLPTVKFRPLNYCHLQHISYYTILVEIFGLPILVFFFPVKPVAAESNPSLDSDHTDKRKGRNTSCSCCLFWPLGLSFHVGGIDRWLSEGPRPLSLSLKSGWIYCLSLWLGLSKVQSGCLDRLFEEHRKREGPDMGPGDFCVSHFGTNFWNFNWGHFSNRGLLLHSAEANHHLLLGKSFASVSHGSSYGKPSGNYFKWLSVPKGDITIYVFVCLDVWVGAPDSSSPTSTVKP